jgi:ATP synthase F1 complex assembly factor 2
MGASEGVIMSRPRTLKKQSGLPHPPELMEKAQEWVDSLDAWHLCALHSVASESKSFLVGMTVLLSTVDSENPFHDLTRAVAASRVEEEFNIDCWGLVEGGHDYDRLNCSVQIHAARVLTCSLAMGGAVKSSDFT